MVLLIISIKKICYLQLLLSQLAHVLNIILLTRSYGYIGYYGIGNQISQTNIHRELRSIEILLKL